MDLSMMNISNLKEIGNKLVKNQLMINKNK